MVNKVLCVKYTRRQILNVFIAWRTLDVDIEVTWLWTGAIISRADVQPAILSCHRINRQHFTDTYVTFALYTRKEQLNTTSAVFELQIQLTSTIAFLWAAFKNSAARYIKLKNLYIPYIEYKVQSLLTGLGCKTWGTWLPHKRQFVI